MKWQNNIPTQPFPDEWIGRVVLLEAEPGQSRRDVLQQLLKEAERNGAVTWLLSCDRDEGGPWAGLKDLFNELLPKLKVTAPDLIAKHSYELAAVLPALQRTISVRNPNLTDLSPQAERTRNYPSDRAYRIVHGLIDLLNAWHQRSDGSLWVISCDHYDRAGALVRRFCAELIRRRDKQLNLTLLIATNPKASEIVTDQFDAKFLGQGMRLSLPPDPPPLLFTEEMARRLAQDLEQQVGEDPIELELRLPRLIRYWLLSDKPENALVYEMEAASIYTTRGLYEDALVYGEFALAQLEQHCPEDMQKRWFLFVKLYNCYIGLGRPFQALQVMEAAMTETDAPEHLLHCCYMMAMLHARYLPEHDLAKAEAYLERGLEELARSKLPEHTKLFQAAFNRNGLALIRHRQGRFQEAVELCRSCYEQLNTHLRPDQHLLHRSVLLYNTAQVYASIDSYDEALAYFTQAIEIDPNYTEYYNERGNVYLKMGRLNSALQDYMNALELSPPFPEVWTNIGQCHRLLGQMTEAVNSYSVALDLAPDQMLALVGRAQALEELRQLDAALADYSAALALNPDQSLVLANRASLYYEAGRFLEALVDLDRAIELSSEIADLRQNRAVVLTTLARFGDAVRDLQSYLLLSPNAENRFEVESKLTTLQSRDLLHTEVVSDSSRG